MNFIDFEKCLRHYKPSGTVENSETPWHTSIPQKIISIIQFYDGFSCQLIHDGNLTEPFTVTTDVRQGFCMPLGSLYAVLLTQFITIRNRRGERIKPCLTSVVTVNGSVKFPSCINWQLNPS
jgi:hypothetical protein